MIQRPYQVQVQMPDWTWVQDWIQVFQNSQKTWIISLNSDKTLTQILNIQILYFDPAHAKSLKCDHDG